MTYLLIKANEMLSNFDKLASMFMNNGYGLGFIEDMAAVLSCPQKVDPLLRILVVYSVMSSSKEKTKMHTSWCISA